MEIIVFIALPAVMSWLFLALAPPKGGFVIFLCIWAVGVALWWQMGASMNRNATGPDNYLRGIGLLGAQLALPAAAGPIVAQVWRAVRLHKGAPTYYPFVLLGASVLSLVIFVNFFADGL